jgi:1-acyl-sn-glycerol-3-phosphate acyltransferase
MRSLLYNIAFYLIIPAYFIFGVPMLLAPRRMVVRGIYGGISRSLLVALKYIVGLETDARGLDNLCRGPVIIAVKHQSTWDTFALTNYFDEPAMILKSELMNIPFLGWFAKKMDMIPVKRGKGRIAIKQLIKDARICADQGREIFIFPEGNRRTPGAEPRYKRGIAAMYRDLGIPVIPVALNSGLYWRRREFTRRPGKVIVEFLPAIEPGLSDDEFMKQLQGAIEPTTDRLIKEALSGPNPPPAPEGYESHES